MMRTHTIRLEPSAKALTTLVVGSLAVWLFIHLWPLLLVIAVALMVVGTMGPVLAWLEGHRVKRGVAIALVFSAMLIAAALILTLTVPALIAEATSLIEHEPQLRADLVRWLSQSHLTYFMAESVRNIRYDGLGGSAVFDASTRLMTVVAYGVSTIFLSLYIVIDRDRLRGGLFAIVPRSHHIRLSRVMINLETIVGAYIRGQLITSLMLAVFTFVLLAACRVPNALALSVVAAVADLLPYVGALLSIAPAVVASLARGPGVALFVLALMLVYEQFESRILVPRIYGRALRLPSTIVFVALMAGGLLMGILGALLALPLAAALMMIVDELRVELPGEQETTQTTELREEDVRGEEEYQRRTEGVPVAEAAAIAVEIAADRQRTEAAPVEPVEPVDLVESIEPVEITPPAV